MATTNSESLAWDNAIRFINSEFGENIDSLVNSHSIFNTLSEKKDSIEKQLSFATTEAPGTIEAAVADAENTTTKIHEFTEKTELLCTDIAHHKADSVSLSKKLSALTDQMKDVEKYSKYLQVISRIEDFSSDVQSALLINSVDRAVAQFFELSELVERLQASSCKNLVKFANDTVLFWYHILKDKFSKEFEEVLCAWRWPFIVSTAQTSAVQNITELQEALEPLFVNLLQLQLPDGLSHLVQTTNPLLESLPSWRPILLPIQLMIKPLRKRFLYHFYGNKQTNSLDKPEWFLSQTLSWIRDHRDFLRTKIQPLLEREGLGYVDVVVEFSRGLMVLVMEKLLSDIPELLYDDHLFSHMVDETLTFDLELRTVYDYPASQSGCLYILTQPQPFNKWILIERKFAQEKLDAMFSSTTAWQSQYKDLSDVDELKIPECGESFMTLMLTITERYKPLPTPQHRLDFLDFQLDLLEDFRYRLIQIKTEVGQEPLGATYSVILNTVSSVIDALRQWSELMFFVQLQYFRSLQPSGTNLTPDPPADRSDPDAGDPDVSGGSGADRSRLDTAEIVTQPSISLVSVDELDETRLGTLEGCVFDEIIDLMERLRNEMVTTIVYYISDDVKARTRAYRNDKWVGMPSPKDVVSPALSTTACEMLLVLRERLQQVEQLLSKQLFTSVWQRVANILNLYFYEELLLCNSFNDGGATQVNFDMTRNLFPLFGQYTQRPETYFKDVKEACHVLTMNVGSALLLKDVLYCALHDPSSDPNHMPTDPIATLHEQGVYKLAPEQVELLLRRRLDLVS